jgi:hypothetical protein
MSGISLYRSPIRQIQSQDVMQYVAMLKDNEVGSEIAPKLKKSVLLKGMMTRFKDIVRVLSVSHGLDRDLWVGNLIKDEQSLEGQSIKGIALDSKEDCASGVARDKIKRMEEQI